MTDRFTEPERSSASDPRRVFIPAPSGARAGGTSAPPRPAPPQRRFRPRDPGDVPPPSAPPRRPSSDLPWFRRVRWRRVVLVVAILLVVGIVGSFLYARSIFNRIERVDVSSSLVSSTHGGTNYLIVGSDSRANVTEEGDPGFTTADAPSGQRSDTIMVLHLEGGKAQMLSIPRDLYVPIAGTDGKQKINAAYNGGPTRLVDTVTQYFDIPIDRYMEVDFVSFAGLVDALGGITIDFPYPAQDTHSGLYITAAGPQKLDGDMALAYVRSRHYEELKEDGQWHEDGTADLGRITRQQKFLTTVFGKLSDTKNPFTLARAADGIATGLRIDDKMSFTDALRLGWSMKGIVPEALDPLPTENARNASGAVLILHEDEAQPILDKVR
ncbi:MAG TPA: LCP family protein [Acidimicrobiales bacterium]